MFLPRKDDGLGCFRGLINVLLFYAMIGGIIYLGYRGMGLLGFILLVLIVYRIILEVFS